MVQHNASLTKTLQSIQIEQRPWVASNFPNREPWQPLIGIVEEIGELFGASKASEKRDAIGDIVIFLLDYCSAMKIEVSIDHQIVAAGRDGLPILAGALCHHHLKMHQGIRGSGKDHLWAIEDIAHRVIAALDAMSGRNLETIARETWDEVKVRDWAANPESGECNES